MERNARLDGWYDVQVFALDNQNEFITISRNITDRKRDQKALLESEEKYRTLFNSIDEGFCIIEVLFDENEHPLDYRFLEVNQAFERQTGLTDATGRCIRDMSPDNEQNWFDFYGRIARTGEPARLQEAAEAFDRYYDVYAFRVGQPEQRRVAVLFKDITERKLAEKALRDSEERLRALTVASTSLVFRMNPDWSCMTELYGKGFFPDAAEPNRSRQWLNRYIHPNDQTQVTNVIQNGKTEKTFFELEHRILKADGSTGWAYSRAIPLFNDRGEIREWFGAASDITERKKAKEELQRYAEELKRKEEESLELLDSFTEGSWIIDRAAGTIKCSEKWAKRIGLDLVPEEERLSYTYALPHPDDTAGGNSIQDYLKAGAARFDLEYRIKTVDRGYIWTQNRGKIVYDGQGKAVKVYAATIDINERKLADEALRRSEEKYRALFDNTEYAFALVKPLLDENGRVNDFRYLDVNPAFERESGLRAADVLGKRVKEMLPGVEAYWLNMYDETLRSGKTVRHEGYNSETGRWYTQVVFPYPEGLLGEQFINITERKLAEEALQKSERVSLDLVEKLRQADQNKDAFISMLSHELRNPLASIMMSLGLLDKVSADGKPADMALEIAKRQGQQLTRLVDDLLDITRITQNKVALKKERIELNEIIKEAILDYQSYFAEKMVRFEVKLTTPLYLEADPYRLTQIIGNLLHNAAKFTDYSDLVTITVSRDENTGEAVITIQDTGQGIAPEFLGNLFEPFMQVDTSLDRKHGGLGLGLAIVKGMLDLHGGRIEAFSEGKDQGAKFTLWLPLPKEDVGAPERDERLDSQSNGSLRILMIDDNKDLARVMCKLINFIGHNTTAAHNGTEGIIKARELRPEAMICDIGLPDMSGYEVARRIRKDPELRDTFLIALSGYAQPEDIERSRAAGFDRHLGKPVSIETLQQVLDAVNR